MNVTNRTIFTQDNLHILRGLESDTIDLIYLDPPFNSKHNYAAPIGSKAAGAAFKDTWTLDDIDMAWWGEIADVYPGLYKLLDAVVLVAGESMMSYLIYMAVRIIEMHRILKPTGSLYLHCDPTAGHYLKLVLDAVFGYACFLADITWKRSFAHNDKMFGSLSDTILYYGKSDDVIKNADAVKTVFDDDQLARKYPSKDSRGRYMRDNLMGPGTARGESGMPWKGCDPTQYGRHWSAPKTGKYAKYINDNLIPNYLKIEGVHARLDALDNNELILWPKKKGGAPTLKRYAMQDQGTLPSNMWTDVPPLARKSKERLGYPTQKPLALLERIIAASSNPGDMVLDPFCGCATACSAAEKLDRQWIGIDISPKAYDLVKQRLKKEAGLDKFTKGAGKVIHRVDIPSRKGARTPCFKDVLYGRQKGKCAGCCHHFEYQHFEIDHVVSRAKGGSDTDDNLQLLCSSCNRIKGPTRDMPELKARLKELGLDTC